MYHAENLDVIIAHNEDEYKDDLSKTVKKGLQKRNSVVDSYMHFGMSLLPAQNAADNKPHILVNISQFPQQMLKNELTHEFSNYELWSKWGTELGDYQVKAMAWLNEVNDEYIRKTSRKMGLLERVGIRSTQNSPEEVDKAKAQELENEIAQLVAGLPIRQRNKYLKNPDKYHYKYEI